jgi:predicted peptidase
MRVHGKERAYVVYVPRGYTPEQAWPLVVSLHGMGERGDDGWLQTEVGIGRAIRRNADRFPCLVVMPQCSDEVYWDKATADIDTALADTRSDYNVDPACIYLTGLSMGGFGAWIYGVLHVDTFAALIPICGGGNPADAPKLAQIPIWVFHGADDDKVPVQKSREMVAAIQKAGGNIKYTEFRGVDHNSWDPAYDDPATMKWLLKQRKPR